MSSSAKSYYDILNIELNANPNQIKKAYHKLAVKYHPDKNQGNKEAEEKFKEISDAYSILSDPKTKDTYDRFGKEGLNGHGSGQGPPGFNPNDIFSQMFGQRHSQGRGRGRSQTVEPIQIGQVLTMEEIYSGKKVTHTVKRKSLCKPCKGTGSSDGKIHQCAICKGQGSIIQMKQIGPMMMQQVQSQCHTCQGRGNTIENECTQCKGTKLVEEDHKITFKIPAGIYEGQNIIIKNQGHELPLDQHGDVTRSHIEIVVQEEEHDEFVRGVSRGGRVNPADLYLKIKIKLEEALCGFSKIYEHLDGHKILIQTDGIIKHEEMKVIPNEGFPRFGKTAGDNGDLFIQFNIEWSTDKTLTEDERATIWEIFTGNEYQDVKNQEDGDLKPAFLMSVNLDNNDSTYDSDDETPDGKRVQCNQQ
jgi:DnaJ family protein A protein 2